MRIKSRKFLGRIKLEFSSLSLAYHMYFQRAIDIEVNYNEYTINTFHIL